MTTLKIASWNVNSLRVRLTQVLSWLDKEKPDLLALRETKVTDDLFPQAVLQEAGYQVIFVCAARSNYDGDGRRSGDGRRDATAE